MLVTLLITMILIFYRANIAGSRVRIINEPLVFHKVSTSTGGLSLFGAYYLTRNRIFFARKILKLLIILLAFSLPLLPGWSIHFVAKRHIKFIRLLSGDYRRTNVKKIND